MRAPWYGWGLPFMMLFVVARQASRPTPASWEDCQMSGRFVRHSVRTAPAGLALCGGATFAALAATGGTASAQSNTYTTLNPSSSFMAIDVSGASTAPGAGVIQWYDNGGSNQRWSVPGGGSIGPIANQNSGMCLTTDGTAGDELFQWYCTPGNVDQQWYVKSQFTW
jgi:Ricin-type beta-trefoil lectin domain